MDISTVAFLTRSVLETKEEEEKKVQAMREEVRDPDGWNQTIGSDGVQFFWHRRTRRSVRVLPPSASRRKKKKREKKKLSRTSSSRGPAHRRQRQWHFQCWFHWFGAHAVSSSLVVRPKLLDIMDGRDQIKRICARRRPGNGL